MIIEGKLLLVITGFIVSLVSTIISGFLLKKYSERMGEIQTELVELNKEYSRAEGQYDLAENQFNTAQLQLSIAQSIRAQSSLYHLKEDATDDIDERQALNVISSEIDNFAMPPVTYARREALESVSNKFAAATGRVPSDGQVSEWQTLLKNLGPVATTGGAPSINTISQHLDELREKYSKRQNNNVNTREELEKEKTSIDNKVNLTSIVGSGFQILGLIIVLLKDVVYP